jgi:hypothetical protein
MPGPSAMRTLQASLMRTKEEFIWLLFLVQFTTMHMVFACFAG